MREAPTDNRLSNRIGDIERAISTTPDALLALSKNELIEMTMALYSELLKYQDIVCDAESAARFFNRKRSWVYQATSRPHTVLQKRLADVAVRQPGGMLFRLSDLAQLRSEFFSNHEAFIERQPLENACYSNRRGL